MEDSEAPRQVDPAREEDMILVPSGQTIENALSALLLVRSYEDVPKKPWRKRFRHKKPKAQGKMVAERLPTADECVQLLASRLTESWRAKAYQDDMYDRLRVRAQNWLDQIELELTTSKNS